ncbi:MAG: PQQ-binding-like beta-propeller repeat protein [Phycisphaerales bacterium JB063]
MLPDFRRDHSSIRYPVGLVGCLLAGACMVGAAGPRAQAQQFEELQVDGVELVEGFEIVDGTETLDDVLGEDAKPGFSFMRGENGDLLDDLLNRFHENLDAGEWEKAFRSLIELTEAARYVMAPLGESSVYVPVRRSIQERLRELPPEGRRAFQLFYDAQAREMLARCLAHPRPGSDEQLQQAQAIYELFFMTSVGDRAADLLGDLYFERGQFAPAQACWEAILHQHPGSSIAEVDLQYKRVLALHRAGRADDAHALAEQVALRFAGRGVAYGGGQPDAAAALRTVLGNAPEPGTRVTHESDPRVPAALPADGADPVWQMTFVDDATKDILDSFNSNNRYYGPTDLRELVPPTAVDDRAVYAHWQGVVFAMDLETGKLLWRTGRFVDAAASMGQRMSTPAGNPRGYKIALTDQHVLVQSSGGANNRQTDRFTLTAYDKTTGRVAWNTAQVPAWRGQSFCGQPIVVNGEIYAIAHSVGPSNLNDPALAAARAGGDAQLPGGNNRTLTLYRIDTLSGQPQWSLPLGEADLRVSPNAQSVWMPHPTMLMQGRNLYVLTNNGAVLGVDTGAGEVAWAVRLQVPEGGNQQPYYIVQPPSANAQGPGAIVLVDGVLYAKEARSARVYAIDPEAGQPLWDYEVPANGELIAADREHLYIMDQAVRAFPLNSYDPLNWNASQIEGPRIGAGLLAGDALYVMGKDKLYALSLESGETLSAFENRYLRGSGGRLITAGDKIICVTLRDITVFDVPTQAAPQFDTEDIAPGN